MTFPLPINLPEELRSIQEKWIKAKREDQDLIYALEFGPAFVPLFARLPLHGWIGDPPKVKALISILGLSWQPVALMAAWARPEHILILGTQDSLSNKIGDEPVLELISRLSGIPIKCFITRQIEDTNEVRIYSEVCDFSRKFGFELHELAVDPTGGKKSMSVSAALAGFLIGAWIVYVDYAQYYSEKRIPVAGTEYPRLLRNPLEVFGDLEFERIQEAYRSGNYEESAHIARNLASKLYEPREAEALALMAEAYGAWHKFRFSEACDILEKLKNHLEQFMMDGKWLWAGKLLPKIRTQVNVSKELSEITTKLCHGEKLKTIEEGSPLVLNHLAAAERALLHHHIGASILLTYATLERYVDICLWVYYGLDDEEPDFSNVSLDWQKFHSIGRMLHKKQYQERDLAGPLTLSTGVQLLAALKPELITQNFLGSIKGLMSDRNKCEFEHGLCPKALSPDNIKKYIEMVKQLLEIILSQDGKNINDELEKYHFPVF
ncbi:MAG: hypothetical protein JRG73_16745 [Deltaproteobacteria bacterium]|nr:hypothetical protein [Deltaproteobacteria bacterium]